MGHADVFEISGNDLFCYVQTCMQPYCPRPSIVRVKTELSELTPPTVQYNITAAGAVDREF